MSQVPPPGQPSQPAYQMQPTQSNGWGIASLICGILSFCTGGTAGILAIIFGFVGISRSKTTHTGKGMSITGLILGLVTSIAWLLFIVFFGGMAIIAGMAGAKQIKVIEAQETGAKQFITDLSTGGATAASNDTDGTMAQSDVQALADQIKDLGTVKEVTSFPTNSSTDATDLSGTVTFDKGSSKSFSAHEVKKGDAWKISSLTFDQSLTPATEPTTAPAP